MLHLAQYCRHAPGHDQDGSPSSRRNQWEVSAQEVLRFNPHNVFDTLWAMIETGIEKLAVFEALCEASAQQAMRFNPQNVAYTLWAMIESGFDRLAVFEAWCKASAQEAYHFNPHDLAGSAWAMSPPPILASRSSPSARRCASRRPRRCCASTRTSSPTHFGP